MEGQADLFDVVEAGRLARFVARRREDGKEEGGQDRDDRDDDEELDEREAAPPSPGGYRHDSSLFVSVQKAID
jgi:hypothetical protein